MAHMEGELSLRNLLAILARSWRILLLLPLVALAAAVFYGFFLATPLYASTATVIVSPLQVQSQLEQKIQVQQSNLLGFDGFRAVALSEGVLRKLWDALKREGKLPTLWQDEGTRPGTERMARFLRLKDRSPKEQAVPVAGQVPPLVVEMSVSAPTPAIAARAANLWFLATAEQVNELPLGRLKASLEALDEQIAPAEAAYQRAQARWEAFSRTTSLPQDKAELEAKTQERMSLDTEGAGLERDLAAVAGRIASLRAEVDRQARIVPINIPPDQVAIMNQRLEAAKERLSVETERARQAYAQASGALEAFKRRERIPQWNAELVSYTEAYANAQTRILALGVERTAKEARLQSVEAELAQEPNLLTLEREVGADPAVLAAAQGGGLQALIGLKLKNQELNPTHRELLSQALGLRADLASLAKEEGALKQEAASLQERIAGLRSQIAAQEREKEALTLEFASKKATYEALRSRFDQIVKLSAPEVAFDSPNPEYQRLRSALIDAQAEEARLYARKSALAARIAQVDARIETLKARLAKAQVESDEVNQALELAKNAYLALVQKKTDLQIEFASSQNSLAQVIAPAYPVYERVAPKRLLMAVVAVVLGFLLALFWAFLAEALRGEPQPRPGVAGGEA